MSGSSSANQSGPFEGQRRIFDLLSQETRHLIVQYVLGHPDHLVSLDELDYMIPKSKAAISDQIDTLVEADILDLYEDVIERFTRIDFTLYFDELAGQ
jgi:predicted transcriptional regulator